jgi:hypothetical protein
MFILTFDNSEDIDKMYKITHILGYKIEIKPMEGIKINRPMQEVPGDNNSESTQKLQMAITEVQRWTRKWRI